MIWSYEPPQKSCGNRTHVRDRHWLSEIVETWGKRWDLPKIWYSVCRLCRLCHTCSHSSDTPQFCHTSFLRRCVQSDGTCPNLLMSLSWTLSFGDCSSQFMYDVLCDLIFLISFAISSGSTWCRALQTLTSAPLILILAGGLVQGSLHDIDMCHELFGPFASSWVAMQGAYREETQMEVNRFDRSDGKI